VDFSFTEDMHVEPKERTSRLSLLRAAAAHWLLLPGVALVVLLSLYCARTRPLWTDEHLTLKLARADGLGELWHLLATATQSDPPLFYLAARASMAIFGDNPVAFRLPSLVGILLLSLSLYAFTARRCPLAYARLAFLFPLLPPVLHYSYEARPYALWLGWSGLALLCWQVAGDSTGRMRRAALIGLAGCSVAAVSTHYYAVLFLAALGLAEMIRTGIRRRLDGPVWLGLALAVVPLLAYKPLIDNAKTFIADSWAAPSWGDLVFTYQVLVEKSAAVFLVLVAVAALAVTQRRSAAVAPEKEGGFRLEEVLAALAVTGIPILGMVLAKAYTNNYVPRYVLPVYCGFSLLVVAAVQTASGSRRWPADLLTVITLALVTYSCHSYFQPPETRGVEPYTFTPAAAEATARAQQCGLPLVTDSVHTFVCGQFPGPEKPIAYVCAGGKRNADSVVRKLRPWYGHIIFEPADLPRLKQFLLVPSINDSRAVESLLWKKGARLSVQRPLSGGELVFLVQLPSSGEEMAEAAVHEGGQ
jgi:hypothetical protein